MNKKTLTLALGSAIAASFMAAPVANAAENPFAMQAIDGGLQVAEAGKKAKEGKCGEGKCSASKAKAGQAKAGGADKMKEGGCSASKAKEGSCGANKMKEGGMKMDAPAQ